MKIYDRASGGYIESAQYGQGKLEFLYGKAVGRILLKIVISPVTSRFYGWLKRRRSTVKDIAPFIEEYSINMDDFEEREFNSFSDFFTRQIKPGARPIDMSSDSFISPADSKLLVYGINDDLMMDIKGSKYTVNELTDNREDLSSFDGGYALVFRLSMDDYHRYGFADGGRMMSSYAVKGKLHTVSSISRDYKIYKENSRVVNHYQTENFDDIIQIEVGALLVGRIVNHAKEVFAKGEEKGYFEPGGSTIIILVKKDIIRIDADILEESSKGIESKVRYGEKIGTRI